MSIKLYIKYKESYTFIMDIHKNIRKQLKLLGLSLKEEKVLSALQDKCSTVLGIARYTKVSRPSVYDILKKLKKRGLVVSKINEGKKGWQLTNEKELIDVLYELKKNLLSFSDGREEVSGVTDGVVTIHRGKDAIRKKIHEIFNQHKRERFLGYSGAIDYTKNWSSIFSEEEISKLNISIKSKEIIVEAVFPSGWAEENFIHFGKEWAKNYEGRSTSTVYAPKKYFQNGGEMFAFKDALYLLALKDKIVIEIRHSDIQKMILAMYSFMKERGETVDVNERLRKLMEKNVEK